jgi:hypothetical protein
MSRHVERLDLRDRDGFEKCVGYKATSCRALHLFLRSCERQLVNPVIALAIAHLDDQLKSGWTSFSCGRPGRAFLHMARRAPPRRSLLRLLFGVKWTRYAQSELFL